MCLLILMPDGKTSTLESLEIAAKNNPDGFGYAISTGTKILTGQSMDFDALVTEFLDVRALNQGPALFHLRIATHGAVDLTNCHPFYLGGDNQTVMAHNGMMTLPMEKSDTRSDSHVFAKHYMPAIGGITALDDEGYFVKLEKKFSGNKIAFLSVNDEAKYAWYILNAEEGDWEKDGIWYSNNSHEKSRYTYAYSDWKPKNFTEYSGMPGGWDDGDYAAKSAPLTPADSRFDAYDDEATDDYHHYSHSSWTARDYELAKIHGDTFVWDMKEDDAEWRRLNAAELARHAIAQGVLPLDTVDIEARWRDTVAVATAAQAATAAKYADWDNDAFLAEKEDDLYVEYGDYDGCLTKEDMQTTHWFARNMPSGMVEITCYASGCCNCEDVEADEAAYYTHCAECTACLQCNQTVGCNCWDDWWDMRWNKQEMDEYNNGFGTAVYETKEAKQARLDKEMIQIEANQLGYLAITEGKTK